MYYLSACLCMHVCLPIVLKTECILTCEWAMPDVYTLVYINISICFWIYVHVCIVKGTFGDFQVSAMASQRAVDLSDQLHVVEQRVEAVEVREADLVRRTAPCDLVKDATISYINPNTQATINYPDSINV